MVALAISTAGLLGCGRGDDGPALYPVTGKVTFDNQPIAEGRVVFRKLDGDQKAFSSEIRDGVYELTVEPGKMSVEVLASRPVPGKFDHSNGTPEPVGEMYIPEKYNSKTTLQAEVTVDGDNEIPFALTST
ncbi:MAG: hypothetical protein M3552_21880 [Planctomycetota bacterium]|nr:hypothetical protein [Planctomycetota bacterium]